MRVLEGWVHSFQSHSFLLGQGTQGDEDTLPVSLGLLGVRSKKKKKSVTKC